MNIETNGILRPASPADADTLVELIDLAGEGLPCYFWSKLANGEESPWDVGRQRALRESGGFSYRNAVMMETGNGKTTGCLIGYELPDEAEPVPDDIPAPFRPLLELENLVPGSWYINVLAVRPAYQNRGLGTRLLANADDIARAAGRRTTSIIVSDANHGARRLYERSGYDEVDRHPMVKEDWQNPGTHWILLTKRL